MNHLIPILRELTFTTDGVFDTYNTEKCQTATNFRLFLPVHLLILRNVLIGDSDSSESILSGDKISIILKCQKHFICFKIYMRGQIYSWAKG